MDPSALIPAASPIQVPWGWFEALLIFTFIVHLLFMNAVLGGALITLVSQVKNKGPDPMPGEELYAKLPTTLALTVNMGVPPFLFLQVLYGPFIYSSSLLMSTIWLSLIGLLIIGYYGLYLHYLKHEKLGSGRNLVLAFSVLILLWVAFVFTNNMTLMLHPQRWLAYFAGKGGTLLNLGDPTLVPRYLHFITASVAVGGLFLALIWYIRGKKGVAGADEKVAWGLKWFSYATVVQLFIGLWFFISLPHQVMLHFLGGSGLHTAALLLSLVGAAAALFFGFKGRLVPTLVSLVATVSLMVMVRALLRAAYLEPYFKVADLSVRPQYSPLILFLVSLVIGSLVVLYMLRIYPLGRKD